MADDVPDFVEILETLQLHRVRYVVIGGFAAVLHGSPHVTFDIDICPARDQENLEHLADALKALGARVYAREAPEGVPFDPGGLERGGIWNLITDAGRLDLTFEPAGTGGYEDLVRDRVALRIDMLEVPVASLADIVRSKEAAGREKDRLTLPTLRELLERQQLRGR